MFLLWERHFFFTSDKAPETNKKDLLAEYELMKQLQPHPNVIRLMGAVTLSGMFIMYILLSVTQRLFVEYRMYATKETGLGLFAIPIEKVISCCKAFCGPISIRSVICLFFWPFVCMSRYTCIARVYLTLIATSTATLTCWIPRPSHGDVRIHSIWGLAWIPEKKPRPQWQLL